MSGIEDISELSSPSSFIKMAEEKADAIARVELENKRRKALGMKAVPLPDEAFENSVRNVGRTGSCPTVDSSEALVLYEKRKAASAIERELKRSGANEDGYTQASTPVGYGIPAINSGRIDPESEKAVKIAESVRRVSDMKGGRVDHAGIWGNGERLEKGDSTKVVEPIVNEGSGDQESNGKGVEDAAHEGVAVATKQQKRRQTKISEEEFNEFRNDLYVRLRDSFKAIEDTLSDLQGRVEEIVTASVKDAEPSVGAGGDEFDKLIQRKTPVVFDVSGTKMAFDAVCVFHASPCITVVSKAGSAFIMPKPGARLSISYEMDGVKYTNDPVTFLGTRFELPMFGLSFVGFIRDVEADMMDASLEEGGEQK